MTEDRNIATRARRRAATLMIATLAIVAALLGTGAAPASASHVVKGSTRCVGNQIIRCAYLEGYKSSGRIKLRAVARVSTFYTGWRLSIEQVRLYRNSHRVTTMHGYAVVEHSTVLRSAGTVHHGEYHAVAKICWQDVQMGTPKGCEWLHSRSKYFG